MCFSSVIVAIGVPYSCNIKAKDTDTEKATGTKDHRKRRKKYKMGDLHTPQLESQNNYKPI
jgi:hypothetical protein